jgi:hypothetical protein
MEFQFFFLKIYSLFEAFLFIKKGAELCRKPFLFIYIVNLFILLNSTHFLLNSCKVSINVSLLRVKVNLNLNFLFFKYSKLFMEYILLESFLYLRYYVYKDILTPVLLSSLN